MPKPFQIIIFIKDLERCPYTWKDSRYPKWAEEDNKRILLINLNRYADQLQKPNWHDKIADLSHIKSDIKQTFKLE